MKTAERKLASRNAGRMILMDTERELRAMDQARLTTNFKKNHSSKARVRTCQSDYGDNK